MFPIIALRTGVLLGFILMAVQRVSSRRPSATPNNGLLTPGLHRDFWGLRGTSQGLPGTSAGLRRTSHSRTQPGLL